MRIDGWLLLDGVLVVLILGELAVLIHALTRLRAAWSELSAVLGRQAPRPAPDATADAPR